MRIDRNTFAIIGIVILAVGVRFVIERTGHDGTDSAGHAPLEESSTASVGSFVTASLSAPINMLGIGPGGLRDESKLLHFFHPESRFVPQVSGQDYVDTRHRYPTVTGTNISTLIHRGYSPLMVPTKKDYDWLVNPPTESMFGA